MNDHGEKAKTELGEITKQKERSERLLLASETVISVISVLFLASMLVSGIIFMRMTSKIWTFLLPLGIGAAQFIGCMLFSLRIEQKAGFYECRKCSCRYVPEYISVCMAMHIGRTRYMKCPRCKKRSWQKKVL